MKEIPIVVAVCLFLALPLLSTNVFAIGPTYAAIVNQSGSLTQLVYDDPSTSYADAGANPNTYLSLCVNDSADLLNKYIGYVYFAGSHYIQLNSYIGGPLGNLLPVLSVNASNCTRIDLDFSSTKAYYPGVPAVIVSSDNMIDSGDTFYQMDRTLAFLSGGFMFTKNETTSSLFVSLTGAINNHGSNITAVQPTIVALFRRDNNQLLDSGIITPGQSITLSKAGYTGLTDLKINGISYYELQPTSIIVLLNGVDGDKTLPTGKVANLTVILNIPGKTVYLATDIPGWTLQSGVTPLTNLTLIKHVGRYNITGYFPGDADYSPSYATHFARGGKPEGETCSENNDCHGGHCVHGFCRSGPTYCGDTFCDSGEDCVGCVIDCKTCTQPAAGGTKPPKPPEEQPPTVAPAAPPKAPEIWPEPVQAPATSAIMSVPSNGLSIVLSGSIVNGKPEKNTVAVLIYPKANKVANIKNLTEIVPADLLSGQVPLASHEINIQADNISYCMNYEGKLGNVRERSISVWKFTDGKWQMLPPEQVLRDTNIICGIIPSASTPYMIAGFSPVIGVMPELALLAIQSASANIARAQAAGRGIVVAQDLFNRAIEAFDSGDFSKAKQLADQASYQAVGLSESTIIAIIILAIIFLVASVGYTLFGRLKPRVKPSVEPVQLIKVKAVPKTEVVHVKPAKKLPARPHHRKTSRGHAVKKAHRR